MAVRVGMWSWIGFWVKQDSICARAGI
jgi:hypothetical protein